MLVADQNAARSCKSNRKRAGLFHDMWRMNIKRLCIVTGCWIVKLSSGIIAWTAPNVLKTLFYQIAGLWANF